MTDEKKIVEYNFDRMRDVIQNTRLPTKNDAGDVVGETRLGTGDVFRLATALINEGFRLERTGTWKADVYGYWERSVCSECGAVYEGDGGNYCSKCGAKMLENANVKEM
jgi:tRNA(Ile2) C34 agmatinyltransferase TiaS